MILPDRVFVDTSYFVARFNRGDQYHARTRTIEKAIRTACQFWTSDAVLLEVMASLSRPPVRTFALRIWDQFHGADDRCRSIALSESSLGEGVNLFRTRMDKSWSLTDCLSFQVMRDHGLSDALTSDQHFVQAGFRALLLE
jgi:uncharacterized protein